MVLTPLSSSESERVRFSEDLVGESGLDLDCLSFQHGFQRQYLHWHCPCLQDRFRSSLWIPSSDECCKSDCGFF